MVLSRDTRPGPVPPGWLCGAIKCWDVSRRVSPPRVGRDCGGRDRRAGLRASHTAPPRPPPGALLFLPISVTETCLLVTFGTQIRQKGQKIIKKKKKKCQPCSLRAKLNACPPLQPPTGARGERHGQRHSAFKVRSTSTALTISARRWPARSAVWLWGTRPPARHL